MTRTLEAGPQASLGLRIALGATVVATASVALVAYLRTDSSRWPLDLARVLFMALLAFLALRGRAWARWVLILLLGLSTIGFFANMFRAAPYPIAFALFIIMPALYIWTIIELTKAAIAGPPISRV